MYQLLTISPIVITGIVRLCETIAVFMYVYCTEGHLLSIGWNRNHIYTGIYKGVQWSFMFGIIVFSLFFLFDLFFHMNCFQLIRMPLSESIYDQLVYFIVGCFIGPFTEEIVFRGVVYGFFRKWGIFFACCISTIIFVLLHHQASMIPFTQITGGILFAISYEQTKQLITPITIHIMGNTMILFLSYFPINL